jgi:hypothetical protein
MNTYLYLSLIPEALIASHLPPEEFGAYFATGSQKRSRGQALFFEVDPSFESVYLPVADFRERCQPRAGGLPRRSCYLSIYQALEHVPIEALRRLHLVTDDGRTLSLEPGTYRPDPARQFHLYQELCPVTPRVVSRLNPVAFAATITDRSQPVSVASIVFAELKLEQLALDPEGGIAENLPYENLPHLRDCLRELRDHPVKPTKMVLRQLPGEMLFRTVRHGFFAGSGEALRYYPMPTKQELETTHYTWWRSAQATFGS